MTALAVTWPTLRGFQTQSFGIFFSRLVPTKNTVSPTTFDDNFSVPDVYISTDSKSLVDSRPHALRAKFNAVGYKRAAGVGAC